MHLLQDRQIVGAKGGESARQSQVGGQLDDEFREGPTRVALSQHRLVIDAALAPPQRFLVDLFQQREITELHGSGRGRRLGLIRPPLAIMTLTNPQILSFGGIDQDGFHRSKRVVSHLDRVAAQLRINAKEPSVQADVGVRAVHRAWFPPQEVLGHAMQIHVAHQLPILFVTQPRRLADLGMVFLVVTRRQPGRQRPIESIQREDFSRSDFGLELILRRAKETFDQASRSRIPHRTMQQPDVQRTAGSSKSLRVVDLGVVQVQFPRRAVPSPRPEQGVDQNVEVLAQVIAGLDHVAAMAIDKRREMGLDGSIVLQHVRSILEVTQPQIIAGLARPA